MRSFHALAQREGKEEGKMGDFKKLPIQQLPTIKPEVSAEDSYWRSFVQVIFLYFLQHLSRRHHGKKNCLSFDSDIYFVSLGRSFLLVVYPVLRQIR